MEQKNKSRARFKIAFFSVLAVNIIPIVIALLMQGCRKPPEPVAQPDTNAVPVFDTNAVPTADTNSPGANVAVVDTNAAPVAPVAPTPAAQEYVVAKGDSFFTIAKKFGVTMKQIQDANPAVQPTKMQIGQKLTIPAPTAAPATAPSAAAPAAVDGAPAAQHVYAVKSGDTLTKIAEEHKVTVKALRSENNLTTDKILVGQKLKIPAKSAAPSAAPTP